MKALAAALVKAQAEFKPIHKDAQNPHFKSKYATFPAFIEGTRAILAEHGLIVLQTTEYESAGATLILVSTLMHAESGEQLISRYPLIPAKNDPQGLGSALTYAKRYAYGVITGAVSTDEDDDGEGASDREKKPKGEKAKPPTNGATIGQDGLGKVWDTARKLWPAVNDHRPRIHALLAKHGVKATDQLPPPVENYINELNETKRLEGEQHAA